MKNGELFEIPMDADVLAKLQKCAAANGIDVDDLILEILRASLGGVAHGLAERLLAHEFDSAEDWDYEWKRYGKHRAWALRKSAATDVRLMHLRSAIECAPALGLTKLHVARCLVRRLDRDTRRLMLQIPSLCGKIEC